jgi:hypothetical protein
LPRRWLDQATTRFVYHFGEIVTGNVTTYEVYPAAACGISRETHVRQLGGGVTRIQVTCEYSGGNGQVLLKKAQADPIPVSPRQARRTLDR